MRPGLVPPACVKLLDKHGLECDFSPSQVLHQQPLESDKRMKDA